MGIFSGLVSAVAPVLGSIFGGPVGGAVGGAMSSVFGDMGSSEDHSKYGSQIGQAIGTGVGSAYSALGAQEGVEQQNRFNTASAAAQMEFQRDMAYRQETHQNLAQSNQNEFQAKMANTTWQRGVADMQAAGLNPMLAYHQGGAPAPSGGSGGSGGVASGGSAPHMESPKLAALNTAASLAKVSAEIQKIQADTSVSKSQALINAVQVPRIVQDTFTSGSSSRHLIQQILKMDQEMREMMPQQYQLWGAQTDLASKAANTEYQREYLVRQQHMTERERTRLERAEATHHELDLTRARNEELAERSGWKENISPYLSDVGKTVGSAVGLRRLGRGALGLRRP